MNKIIGAFIRLKNRRVYLRRQSDGTLLFIFKRYDAHRLGRMRERVVETPLALSDEAFYAMAQLYATKGTWDIPKIDRRPASEDNAPGS